ncbi:hypothetical protein [Streptomyces sp. HUAS ZL42]|uniref:hypothetical protein n=1 Tax=Streptomyces sp. HUAS ZL42 TaxID=3231715 RepID=UPI00345E9E4A
MTAEHDNRDDHDGLDPGMVALLREQLGVIADALTEADREGLQEIAGAPHPAPVRQERPVRPPRRRWFPLAVQAAGVAVAGSLVVGLGWLVSQAGSGANDLGASSDAEKSQADSDSKADAGAGSVFGAPTYLACARLVVEGDVTDVERVPGTARDRVVLRVTRYYKPDQGKAEVSFVVEQDMDPLLNRGDHVLVGFSGQSATPDAWVVGAGDIAREEVAVAQGLSESRALQCAE